tara:strand:+ start:922 stop:1188 length:267 start_codon:yes stop_codon:yes gene_type:complete
MLAIAIWLPDPDRSDVVPMGSPASLTSNCDPIVSWLTGISFDTAAAKDGVNAANMAAMIGGPHPRPLRLPEGRTLASKVIATRDAIPT